MRNRIVIVTLAALSISLTACKSEPEPEAAPEEAAEAAEQPITTEIGFKARHPQKPNEPWPEEFKGGNVALGPTTAYLSLPQDAQAPLPALVLVHDRWGLEEHIKLWADRLAAEGYAALAVDLYGGRTTMDGNEANALSASITPDEAREIFGRALNFLRDDERVTAQKTGFIGWGVGGRWAMRAAMMYDNVAAVVDYFALPLTPPDEVRNLEAPVLAFFGKKDISTPPPAVDALETWLTEGEVTHEVVSYPVDHAWTHPIRGAYSGTAAAEAWEKTREFLDRWVKQPAAEAAAAMAADGGEGDGGAADGEAGDGAEAAAPAQ